MKTWVIAHSLLSFALILVIYFEFDLQSAAFFALGTILSLANIGLLVFAWKRILAKKSVAFAASVIVFKYGFTIFVIYKVAKMGLSPLGWLAGGLALFMLSALSMTSLFNWGKNRQETP